ncbi:MAG: DUF1992 domain-containing protein [Gammaproteobacteria bacterium]|nr:DUF1992 domain-containing protein [Gammaproteobacteria bacterium]NIM72141.1 DUF1992 domain-containing protein [Gammaproteobacteria bacterium]NIN38738.1 DUF1992 domain-containing protein [Gammaproteobacteria bacterium]NIO23883.1 DUF1992 domain-containing protein [Gammaproteobacteria bacterium]NIO64526.1 DUF1992 domain-containing protein [Gammaproteobacteria bacterium]
MGFLTDLVEERIRAAMQAGAFDDLPGRGQPLALGDDILVPEDMRLAYRLLKNAGYLPEELALRREIADVQTLLGQALDAEERRLASGRLALLRMRLAARSGERPLHLDAHYDERLRRRLSEQP